MTRNEIQQMPDPWILHKQITEGEWSGHTTYRCPCCEFDSTNRGYVETHLDGHIRGALARSEPTEQTPVGLFGADGRPIKTGA